MTILPHLSGIRLRSRNSYLNRRYGLSLAPTSAACLLHAYLDPRFRAAQARQIRHLKLPHPGATLLDIGCGSGSFVAFARTLGWSARGIDIDPGAVDAGLSAGLPLQVRTIGEEAAANAGTFDAVTMEHVLEHVPDPLAFLRTAGRLLKPGGQLWIATPNVRSAAHLRFGRHWKHLDPPRHVVIFTPQIVDKLLRLAGFHTIRTRASASGTIATYAHSSMIALGRSPVGAAPASRAAVIRGALAGLRSLVQPDVAEEIVRTAISTR
ncbi:MAG: class I SAM-dependent methyltransferase [Solirubrobacteraceae bacterium]